MIKTNHILFILILICFCCIIPVTAYWEEYWAPWITNLDTSSVTINWRQGDNNGGIIQYANISYYSEHNSYDHSITYLKGSKYQHIDISGLDSNTTYKYWVQPSQVPTVFTNRTFTTMPLSGPFTFIVMSDSHAKNFPNRYKAVVDAIAKETDILFILHGGDYAGKDEKEGFADFFHYSSKIFSKITIFPCIGNHEYHDPENSDNDPTNADYYRWAFNMPMHYSFECSGVRFIILQSPDPATAESGDDPHTSLALAKKQEAWLKEQLEIPNKGVFVLHHHPIWRCGETVHNSDFQPWETLYRAYNISACFAGHTHNYQRLLRGMPYYIVGTAGGKCSDLNNLPTPRGYKFGDNYKIGYLKVTVDPTKNTAKSEAIFVAKVKEYDSDKIYPYDHPIIEDSYTFPLKPEKITPLSFSGTPRTGFAPLEVTFTTTDEEYPDQWYWTFGDGGTSINASPTHVYSYAGNYSVNLTVTYPDDTSKWVNKTDYISVMNTQTLPVAAFSGVPTTGSAPLSVAFTDESTGNPIQWIWSFGDGRSSNAKNPVHLYSDVGNYTVWLCTQYLDGNSSSLKRKDYIHVTITPTPTPTPTPELLSAQFNAQPLEGQPPLNVSFVDTSSGFPTRWKWNFGDGSSSYEQNTTHVYTGIGLYSVTLMVEKDRANAVTRKPSLIAVTAEDYTGFGVLIVNSNPTGAMVYLNGTKEGVTPRTIENLVPGMYSISLAKIGYLEFTDTVFVRSQVPTVLSPQLNPEKGSFMVQKTAKEGKPLQINDDLMIPDSPLVQGIIVTI